MSYVPLTTSDLLLAATLLAVNAAISWGFQLKLEKSIAIAVVRMVVQLALIGIVLKFVFVQSSPIWTAMLGLIMVFAAGIEVVTRQAHPVRGWHAFGLQTATLFFIGMAVTGLGVGIIIGSMNGNSVPGSMTMTPTRHSPGLPPSLCTSTPTTSSSHQNTRDFMRLGLPVSLSAMVRSTL